MGQFRAKTTDTQNGASNTENGATHWSASSGAVKGENGIGADQAAAGQLKALYWSLGSLTSASEPNTSESKA